MKATQYVNQSRNIGASDSGGIRERWMQGLRLLADPDLFAPGSSQLRPGVAAELIEAHAKRGVKLSERELQWRLRCARTYKTETEFRNAITEFPTWFELTQAGATGAVGPVVPPTPEPGRSTSSSMTGAEFSAAGGVLNPIGPSPCAFCDGPHTEKECLHPGRELDYDGYEIRREKLDELRTTDAGHAGLSLVLPLAFGGLMLALAIASGKLAYLLAHIPGLPIITPTPNGFTLLVILGLAGWVLYRMRGTRTVPLDRLTDPDDVTDLDDPWFGSDPAEACCEMWGGHEPHCTGTQANR